MVFGFCSLFGGSFRLRGYELLLTKLTRKSGPARSGTQPSFQLLCVPLNIALKITVWSNAYIIHVTSNWAFWHRLVVSHITKHSSPLNSVVRSHILLHGILLWLTGTAVRDRFMIHRYCDTRAYCDSSILRRGIIFWFNGTAALEPIVTHGYCGAGSYFDSTVLWH